MADRTGPPPLRCTAAKRGRGENREIYPCPISWRAAGVGMNSHPLIEFFVSVGYGRLSSLVPVFNSEIYIVASQVGGFTEEVTTSVGCAVGPTIGKVGTVPALRGGGGSGLGRRLRQRRDRPRKPVGRVRTRLRGWSDRLLRLLG